MGNPLTGLISDIYATSTPSIALSSPEACTDSGDLTTYIADTHEFWDFTKTFAIECSPDGTDDWEAVEDYTMLWSIGRIVFETAREEDVNDHVRIASGSYLAATQLDESHAWSLALKAATKDTTVFQTGSGWQRNTATIKSGTAKVDTYRYDERMADELANIVGLKLYVNKDENIRWQGYGIVSDVSPKSDVNNIQAQSISFTSVKGIYFLTS